MKVILAGCPKTGTKTMCAAFEILGIRTYDVLDNLEHLWREWDKILTTGGTVDDFRRMYKGVDAVTDIPCNWFWEELLQAFPEAKIILTVRDEDAWYESYRAQAEVINNDYLIWLMCFFSPSFIVRSSFRRNMQNIVSQNPSSFRVNLHNKMILQRIYRQHNIYVQQRAPKDKLLVYRPCEGWEPLCRFLEVDIPSQPFPHKNKKGAMLVEWRKHNQFYRRIALEAFVSMSISGAAVLFLGYKVYRNGGFSRLAEIIGNHWTMVKNIGQ